jgi:hypothetical protein
MSASVPFSSRELEQRRPVWDALSTLYLDTDVTLLRAYRARILAASPFSLEELEAILIDEVYPVCWANLLSIPGEWAGFDAAWLESRIVERLTSPWRGLHKLNFGRISVPASTEWHYTKRAILEERGLERQAPPTHHPSPLGERYDVIPLV